MFAVLAFVLFVVAAVLCFFGTGVELRDIIGVISAGLAALAVAGVPVAEWRTKINS